MLEHLRGAQGRLLRPVARRLLGWGLRPDLMTWFGAVSVSVVALICFPSGWLWQGAVLAALLSCTDMIDGHMARESGSPSRWGAFLDSTLDRVSDAAILGGLTWHLAIHSSPWTPLAGWALAAAQLTSYVKARAEATGCSADVGLITRADRVAVALLGAFLAGVGLPLAVEVSMALLAVGGTVSVAQRIITVRRQLAGESGSRLLPG